MSLVLDRNFKFSGNESTLANVNAISEPLESCYNYSWSITPIKTGVTGDGLYTLQVSNDSVTWFDYKELSVDVSTEDAIDDIHLNFLQARIVHKAGTTTSGTIQYKLVQKHT